MNTPTPTPRTDTAWSASFEGKQLSAGQTARALRDCSQQLERELTALTTERDQLRFALDACRSAQIKPLVWYPKGYIIDPNDLGKINEHQVQACVAAIDAAMKVKEDCKV
jgi:hypothetical protein